MRAYNIIEKKKCNTRLIDVVNLQKYTVQYMPYYNEKNLHCGTPIKPNYMCLYVKSILLLNGRNSVICHEGSFTWQESTKHK